MFEIAGLELPDPLLITLFLLVYILVLGPINFIILRRMKRPELAWATVPALVIVFSVGAYLIGYGSRGGDLTTIRTKIAYASPDTQDVQAMQVWGLFSPVRNTYKLNIGADSVVSELNAFGGPGSGSTSQVLGGSTTSVNNVIINTGSLSGFAVQNDLRTEPPLEADLHLNGDQIVGTVHNRTGGSLQDVALIRGYQVQYIGGGRGFVIDTAAIWRRMEAPR